MYKKVDVINVSIWGKKVGSIAMSPKFGYYVFAYEPSFIKTGIELSPLHMPLNAQIYTFKYLPELTYHRLPAMIADSLPDKFGNDLIDSYMMQRGVNASQISVLDRLAYMGKRSMGALEFQPSRGGAKANHTAIDMKKLVEAARKAVQGSIETDAIAEASLKQIIQVGTSAGGARAKAVIAYNENTQEIRAGQFDIEEGFEHWLLKFDGMGADRGLGKTKNHGRIEFSYYQMAILAGMNMTQCRLLEENGRAHFMTKRFDRSGNAKHHIQTLCAMEHMNFQQLGTYDHNQVFSVVENLKLGYEAKEEVYRRMVFNVMAANCDDHTKNLSFILRQGENWQLAPAYDVAFAFNPDGKWTFQHFMSINGKFKNITIGDLLSVADRFAVGTSRKVIDQVGAAIAGWDEIARLNNIPEAEVQEVKKHHKLIK